MKKIPILLAAFLVTTCIFAQRTTEIPSAKLPKAATEYIADNLPGATITKAAKVEDSGVVTYNVGIDVKGHKHLLIFDKDGKFLKKGDALINSTAPKSKTTAKPVQKAEPDQKQEVKKK